MLSHTNNLYFIRELSNRCANQLWGKKCAVAISFRFSSIQIQSIRLAWHIVHNLLFDIEYCRFWLSFHAHWIEHVDLYCAISSVREEDSRPIQILGCHHNSFIHSFIELCLIGENFFKWFWLLNIIDIFHRAQGTYDCYRNRIVVLVGLGQTIIILYWQYIYYSIYVTRVFVCALSVRYVCSHRSSTGKSDVIICYNVYSYCQV